MKNLSRYCVNCEEKESDHPGGQCLFSSQKFEPHRLSGDSSQCLWAPVTVDVMIADKRLSWPEDWKWADALPGTRVLVTGQLFPETNGVYIVRAPHQVSAPPLVQEPEDQ